MAGSSCARRVARTASPPDQARSGDGSDASRRLADRHGQEHREGGGHQVAEMSMRYPAVVTKEGKKLLADFRPALAATRSRLLTTTSTTKRRKRWSFGSS